MLSSRFLAPIRKFSTSNMNLTIKTVTIIGSGFMGSGIAQVSAASGNTVHVVDTSESALTTSKSSIEKSLARIGKKTFKDDAAKIEEYVDGILSLISFSTDINKAVSKSDLVLEAIVENLDIKKKLFNGIDKVAPPHTIFASNTSSIPIGEIASDTARKDKFGGLHFFSPVPMMKLLEVIRIKKTSDETFDKLLNWGKSVGKVTVSCGDTPGFIVNRLLVPYMMEAIRLYERGDASTRDIDTAMKLGAGYPMGPFELCDYIGLDVIVFICEGWEKRFPSDPTFKTPIALKKLVAEGKLGVKSGAGWYDYSKK